MQSWFEPPAELVRWLKEMRTVSSEHDANVKCCSEAGYVSNLNLTFCCVLAIFMLVHWWFLSRCGMNWFVMFQPAVNYWLHQKFLFSYMMWLIVLVHRINIIVIEIQVSIKKIIVSVFFACNRMYIIKATTAHVVSTESFTNYTRRLDLSRDEVINQNNSIEKWKSPSKSDFQTCHFGVSFDQNEA